MRAISTPFFAASMLLALVGCDDDDGGSGLTSSVPGDRALSSLSEADVQTLCGDLRAYVDGVVGTIDRRQVCTYAAAILVADATACEQAAAQCAASQTEREDGDDNCAANFERDYSDCDASVDEFLACTGALINGVAGVIRSAQCGQQPRSAPKASQTSACDAIHTRCPQAFDDDEDDEETI